VITAGEVGLPPGALNFLNGAGPVAGDALAGHPGVDAVAFIGSIATGRSVAARAAGKAQILELGGNGPLVVLDDAELDAAVAATLEASYLCAGQSCTAGERILVHRAVRGAFVERLEAAVAAQVHLGDPFASGTTMGPLNNDGVAAKTDEHVAQAVAAGARVAAGGRRADGFPTGLYWQPTVLEGVTPDMLIAREETFGPVAPVIEVADDAEALALTNASPYGLLTAVFTEDLGRGLRFAEAVRSGWVNINASTNYWESHLPFGGRSGSASGRGRVGGATVLEQLSELKTITFPA
jgi:succinate-semialdehyde dehydrogenase/glutarate-semialdehyde dehydrogenase